MTLRSGNRCDVCRRAQCLTFQFHPTHLPPEQTRSAAVAPREPSCSARIISPSAVCTTSRRLHKDSTASLPQSGRRPPLHLARGVIRYGMGYFRRRKQLWGCSQLHLPCRWGNSSVRCREGMEGINCTIGQQSSSNRCDSSRCTVRSSATRLFNPGAAGTDKLCSVTRPASRHVSCARLISPSFVCTQQGDHTRMQSPCYPKSARGRPCTVRAASYDMPGDISRGGSSFGTAASCNCRVVG